nr:hypothetical protein [Bifidobacterium aquikefiri]
MFNQPTSIPEVLRDVPLVLVDTTDKLENLPSVVSDELRFGRDVAERLIRAGCKRIAYIGLNDSIAAET